MQKMVRKYKIMKDIWSQDLSRSKICTKYRITHKEYFEILTMIIEEKWNPYV